jgi:putative NADH-flavin reductase
LTALPAEARTPSEEFAKMKLLILGATGGIGIELVRQAVDRGHAVTALVRSRQPLSPLGGRISIIEGDLLDAAQLKKGASGHDAILSAFGPRLPISKSDARLLRNFASALVPAMQRAQVQRAIVVSTAFLFKDALIPYVFGRLFFRGVVADATGMEATLVESGLDVTIVRPPELTNKPHTGKFRMREGHLPRFGLSIPRADVADCMLNLAEHYLFPKSVVGVAT